MKNDFDTYQETVDKFILDTVRNDITYSALGLAGEAGEVAEKIKKWKRDGGDLDNTEVAKELGDVLFYLAKLATECGYDLFDVAELSISKLESRLARGVISGSGDNR